MNERVMTEGPLVVSVPGGELVGWDAFRYTQRGVAPSVTGGPFTIEQHVADALAVLDRHGVAAATVIGHSWGGYLAMQVAARAPGRVCALVLADPPGAVGDGGLAGFGAELEARATAEARVRIAELDGLSITSREQEAAVALEYFRLEWPGLFAAPADAPPVPGTVRVSPEAFEQASASVAGAAGRGDLPGLLSGFTGPVEVVAGECSPLPRQAAESAAAVFPDARLTIAPGAGHQVWHEAPGCLAAALSRVAARLA
jgi:proline iminopeptidase